MNAHPRRLTLIGVLILTAGVAVWTVLSLRDDGSTLSVFVRYASERMGWSANSTAWGVLRRMAKYEKRGRYDDAINAGVAWTEKHPKDRTNDWVFRGIAVSYLEKAKKEPVRADECVRQAMFYEEKHLPFAVDDISALRDLASFAEVAGDVSGNQRCAQYDKAIKVLQQLEDALRERRTVAPKEEVFVAPRKGTSAEYVLTVEDIDAMLESASGTITRVRQKMQGSACP